ncbi:lysozyme family protein [Methylobacterium sp. PvP062]|uniref:Lysozyme family protein n=1 Tax=Methylobacterium radiotolerans TaxID=31998 RepID=A0ABV2NL70_9HYPH|nr:MULTISPECIES: glycosyl hydrolase 108 family protein [unclassified Methylobacterium]KZC01417.1 hypothetical protein AU375_02341 [Methylobacterium radiotolerans]MBP2496015.1 lysozyme family protein [Methylobacterium sp. PvP105]MBP2504114.1 lysozyme family protein [Methylobacterium sp. PvP109]MCX7333096.1 glycoside hydrolase family 108 protein [Hyphomicrobiales bacterium]
MKTDFELALAKVLVFEGGKVDDPKDPGGRTAYGVTQHVYDGWRLSHGLPLCDVFAIAPAERSAIYDTQYWDKVRGDDLPSGIDFVLFDGSVHSGPVQSIKWVQRALGTVRVDGVMGAATVAAIRAYPDQEQLIVDTLARRKAFLAALKRFRRYGRGWYSRVDQLQKLAIEHVAGAYANQPTYFAGMDVRAHISDAKSAPSPAVADAVTGGGVFATLVDQVTTALNPLANTLPSVGTFVGVVTAVGGLAAAGGFAYRWWATRKAKQLADALDAHPAAFVAPATIPAADEPQATIVEVPAGLKIQPAAVEPAAEVAPQVAETVLATEAAPVADAPEPDPVAPAPEPLKLDPSDPFAFHDELPSAPSHLVALPAALAGVHS